MSLAATASGRSSLDDQGPQTSTELVSKASRVDPMDCDDGDDGDNGESQNGMPTARLGASAAMAMPPSHSQPEHLVQLRCESARNMATLLHCLKDVSAVASTTDEHQQQQRFKSRRTSSRHRMQPVSVYCTPKGLTFHVSTTSKQSQASVEWPAGLCSFYEVCSNPIDTTQGTNQTDMLNSDGGEFCVNLTTLLDCMSIVVDNNTHQSSVSGGGKRSLPVEMSWSYSMERELLKMELDPHGASAGHSWLCTAAIPGMEPPDDSDQASNHTRNMVTVFASHPVTACILAPSQLFEGIVTELQMASGATTVTIRMGYLGHSTNTRSSRSRRGGGHNDRLVLEFVAKGYTGQCVMQLTDTSGTWTLNKDAVAMHSNGSEDDNQSLRSNHPEYIQHSYSLASVLQSMRPLDLAQETCLSINAVGMMAVQHRILFDNASPEDEQSTPAFCDFVLCSLRNDDDDSDNDGGGAVFGRGDLDDFLDASQSSRGIVSAGASSTADGDGDRHRYGTHDGDDEDANIVGMDGDDDDDVDNDAVGVRATGSSPGSSRSKTSSQRKRKQTQKSTNTNTNTNTSQSQTTVSADNDDSTLPSHQSDMNASGFSRSSPITRSTRSTPSNKSKGDVSVSAGSNRRARKRATGSSSNSNKGSQRVSTTEDDKTRTDDEEYEFDDNYGKSQQQSGDEEEEEEEEEETQVDPPVAAPLFGTVASIAEPSTSATQRRQRRRLDGRSSSASNADSKRPGRTSSKSMQSSQTPASSATTQTPATPNTPRGSASSPSKRKTRSATKKRRGSDADGEDGKANSNDGDNLSVDLFGGDSDESDLDDDDMDDDEDDMNEDEEEDGDNDDDDYDGEEDQDGEATVSAEGTDLTSSAQGNRSSKRRSRRSYAEDRYCSSPEMVYD